MNDHLKGKKKMRKIVIDGTTFYLGNRDEVTYGAKKELERVQFAASMAMLSNKDVAELATKAKKKGEKMDETEFMDRVMSGEIKESLLDSNDAAVTREEEAIILSTGIPRNELMRMSAKVVEELGKESLRELGRVVDFSEASSTPTK